MTIIMAVFWLIFGVAISYHSNIKLLNIRKRNQSNNNVATHISITDGVFEDENSTK